MGNRAVHKRHGHGSVRGGRRPALEPPDRTRSVDVVHGVVDVELARRRDQAVILDDLLHLQGRVVQDHQGGFLVLSVPDREPDLVARLVELGLDRGFTMVDIPGLIEGASAGRGLGLTFLRHIERTRVLAFVIEITEPDPHATFKVLKNERIEICKCI